MARRFDTDDEENVPLLTSSNTPPTSRTRARCSLYRCWQCVAALLLVALISVVSLAFLVSPPNPKEFPPDGPGIGISLSTDYNTIAVRQDDGTAKTVARIQVTEEFTDLLRRLSLPSSQHPTPPYHSFSESMRDRPRQWVRNLRKRCGYPASSDVAIIARAIHQLIAAVEDFLPPSQLPLTSALVALPNAIALYHEDAQDALSYLGLQMLRGHNVYQVLRALPAAFAGHGLGLCSDPANFERCLDEEKEMQDRGVLAVDLNRAALGVDARGMDTPAYGFNELEALLDWDAGLPHGEPNKIYWERVRGDIRRGVDSVVRRSGRPEGAKFVDDVLMVGEMGANERLAAIVRESVAEVQEEEATIRSERPQFVVAEGAAELAKRLLLQRGRFD